MWVAVATYVWCLRWLTATSERAWAVRVLPRLREEASLHFASRQDAMRAR